VKIVELEKELSSKKRKTILKIIKEARNSSKFVFLFTDGEDKDYWQWIGHNMKNKDAIVGASLLKSYSCGRGNCPNCSLEDDGV
jgi:hypothetical protein